ncbi:hypothetical protein Emag_001287 [Eimeria magna]
MGHCRRPLCRSLPSIVSLRRFLRRCSQQHSPGSCHCFHIAGAAFKEIPNDFLVPFTCFRLQHPSTKHLYVTPCSPFRKFAEEQPSRHDLYYAVAGGDLEAVRSFRPYWNIPICTYRQPGYGEIFTTAQLCLLLQQDRLLNILLADPFTDVEARSFPSGWTLLMLACAADASLGIISLILQRGSGEKYVNAISASNNTALDCVPGNSNVYLMLRARGALLAREVTGSQPGLDGTHVDADGGMLSARPERENNAGEKPGEPQQVQSKLRLSLPSHSRITAGGGGEEKLVAEEGEEPIGSKNDLAARVLTKSELRTRQGSQQEQGVHRSRQRRSVEGRTEGRNDVRRHKERKGESGEEDPPAQSKNIQGKDDLKQAQRDPEGPDKSQSSHRRGVKGEGRRRRPSRGRKEHPENGLPGAGGDEEIASEVEQGTQEAKGLQEGEQQTKQAHRSRHQRRVESVEGERFGVERHTSEAGNEESVKPEDDEMSGESKGVRDMGAHGEKDVAPMIGDKAHEPQWSQEEGEKHKKLQHSSHGQGAKSEETTSSSRQEKITEELLGTASEIACVQENVVRKIPPRSSSSARFLQGHLSMSPKAMSFRSSQLYFETSPADSSVSRPPFQLIGGPLLKHSNTSLNAISPRSTQHAFKNASSTDSPTLKLLSQQADGKPSGFSDKRAPVHIDEVPPVVTATGSSSNVLGDRFGNLASLGSENNRSLGSPQAAERLPGAETGVNAAEAADTTSLCDKDVGKKAKRTCRRSLESLDQILREGKSA